MAVQASILCLSTFSLSDTVVSAFLTTRYRA